MTTETIKWGVLGYARIAKMSLIPAIRQAGNSELYAVASRDPEKRKECEELFGPAKLYGTYEELLDDPDVQAVYIPLPNSMHKEWAIKAMAKGKHVLCEKPMALDAAETLDMIEASKRCGVWLMEAFMYRFTDLADKVKAVVAGGEIGPVRAISSTYRFFLDRPNTIKVKPELGGGSLYDVGCYPVSFINMITGKLPVSCAADAQMENGVDVSFSGVLKYDDGVIATVSCGFNAFREIRSEIVGTLGRIEIPETFAGADAAFQVVTAAGSRTVPVADTGRYALEVADFADAVLHNRPPRMTLEDSLLNMQVIDMLLGAIRKEA
ncbi:Gfo/Idh/MocA family protein [Gorillibacterium sp. sgz5001074]|uniref:Gfo/Idh/MocA family protein n=1 Tax=Gorillibacterium sp. sgz5001074 TaxID=3446695 RepID=UPI003F669213